MNLFLNNSQAFEIMEALITRKELFENEAAESVDKGEISEYGNLTFLRNRIRMMEALIDEISDDIS